MVGDCRRREVRAPFPDEMRRSKMGCHALNFYARPGNLSPNLRIENLVRHVECRFGEVTMTSVNRRRVFRALLATLAIVCAANLSEAVAEENDATSARCLPTKVFADPLSGPRWNGWGVDPSQRRFQPAEMAQLAAEDVPRLKLKWAFGFPGADFAYAQPTVMGGRIFIGSQSSKVYSLDAKTGCAYWEFDAGANVRKALTVGQNATG